MARVACRQPLTLKAKGPGLSGQGSHQRLSAQDVYHAREIVGEHRKRHFRWRPLAAFSSEAALYPSGLSGCRRDAQRSGGARAWPEPAPDAQPEPGKRREDFGKKRGKTGRTEAKDAKTPRPGKDAKGFTLDPKKNTRFCSEHNALRALVIPPGLPGLAGSRI